MDFDAKCVLLNVDTDSTEVVTIKSIEDIKSIVGGDAVTQVDISKYLKVYYDGSLESISKGVSGYIQKISEHNPLTGQWDESFNKEFFSGSRLLLVLCDDNHPIDITETELNVMLSCVKI